MSQKTLDEAASLLASGDAQAALSLLEAEGDAATPEALLHKARALLSLGRRAEARKAAKSCLRRRIGDPGALSLLDQIDDTSSVPGATAPGASVAASTALREGDVLPGDFVIERKLGEGGMGAVYLAREPSGHALAVKVIPQRRLGDEAMQQAFMRELATWLSLPAHPNIVACRFFRTVRGQVAIFAEHVDAGSLDRHLAEQRARGLPWLLDVAIQTAWGLGAVHGASAVHQDVKPSNVLLTRGGVAKVGDFGLSRALRGGAGMARAGLSEAYCSPEQAAGRAMTPASDVYSWGVLLLELLIGRCPSPFGPEALAVLGRVTSGAEPSLYPIGEALASLLARALCEEPSGRFSTGADAAAALAALFEQVTGEPYQRATPEAARGQTAPKLPYAIDASAWQRRAALAERNAPPPPRDDADAPPQARAVADLAALAEAAATFERLAASGRPGASADLGLLLRDKAFVHLELFDYPGALACFERASALLEPAVLVEGRRDLARQLVTSIANAAACHRALGEGFAALSCYARASSQLTTLVSREGRDDLRETLGTTLGNQAVAARDQGDLPGALALLDQSIAHLTPLATDAKGARTLATMLNNKGAMLRESSMPHEAATCHQQALSLLEQHAARGRDADHECALALTLHNLAGAQRDTGQVSQAIEHARGATALRARLVDEGRADLLDDLSISSTVLGALLSDAGDVDGSAAEGERAVALFEKAVFEHGRSDAAQGLATAYLNAADAQRSAGRPARALDLAARAVELCTRMHKKERRPELYALLLQALINQGAAQLSAGDAASAAHTAGSVVSMLEQSDGVDGASGFEGWARVVRAQALLAQGARDEARDDAARALVLLPIAVATSQRADLQAVYHHALLHLAPLVHET